ncbi:SRPBCC family protein [Thalassococcus sp. S3]|uniref:SRPBCC family protein n=1 Tax=Thalassococcus sp. S3 TaxID=2017482 RepID=UPI0010242BE7|nr:SRPBCC family protein [Thalassococcus sp. S3]QBF29939.1 hypothetical protein CFI11_01725 [Thalassococcus sp. S3]
MRTFLSFLGLTAFLAACSEPEVPSSPPQMTTPPDVATSGFLTAYAEDTIPMEVPRLRAFLEEQPLIGFLEPTENISNPVASQVLDGTWPQPGAARWLRLADGHYVIERVIENDPDFFKYQVFIFTNSTGRGVDQIVGEQRFIPVEGGTRFEWTYNVAPSNFITRQIVRRNMPEIERYITGGLQGFANAARAEVGER